MCTLRPLIEFMDLWQAICTGYLYRLSLQAVSTSCHYRLSVHLFDLVQESVLELVILVQESVLELV
jgi:hypothetical protein